MIAPPFRAGLALFIRCESLQGRQASPRLPAAESAAEQQGGAPVAMTHRRKESTMAVLPTALVLLDCAGPSRERLG